MKTHVQIPGNSTLREKVAEFLRREISSNRLEPGKRLTEKSLGKYLGVSRTPIREAFYNLEAEGFLTIKPRQGVRVAEFDTDDIVNYYEIRKVLEGYAARQAAAQITAEEINLLKRLNRRYLRMSKDGRRQSMALVRVHDSFHIHVVKFSNNPRMLDIYNNLGQRCLRYRFMAASKIDVEEIGRDHTMIIEALRRGNADAAEKAVHINAERGLRALLKTFPYQIDNAVGFND